MATLLNDRNELLYSSSSRVTGAVVTVSAGAATSLIFPKPADGTTTIVPVPAALTLTATATGYVTPSYTWSYRFGDSGNFTSITGTTNSVAFTTNTAFATSAGTNTIVQFKVVVAETASNIGVNQAEYTLSIPILREGTNGINSLLLSIYKRTATNVAPTFTTQDLAATSTYTFSSSQVVGQPTGWTQTIPAASGGAYLWISQVQVASVTSSYAFSNALYSSPVLFSQDGTSGTPGTNTALIYAYKRSATAPTDNPGIVDYSFSTNAITTATLSNSWSKTIPSGTDPLYVVIATAASTTSTDNVLAAEWTQPVLLVKNGTDGTPGINSATIYLYARNSNSSTAPSLVTTGSATYNFATGALSGTIPSGWTTTIPAESNGSVVWVVQATAAATTETDDIPNTGWSTPRVLGQQGSNGSPGTRGTRDLYSADANYSSTYVYLTNAAGPASYAVLATTLIASATSGSTPTTPITGDTVTFSNNVTKTFTGSIAGYVLTVTSATAGSVVIGQTLSGTGIANGTVITSFISGTNGAAGTYGVTASQTTSSTTITAISGNYVYTLTYDGTSWKTPGTVIDGSLLVTGTVTASKINTNGLTIKDATGNTIFSAGVPLTSTYLSTSVNNDIAAGVSAGATATAASTAAAAAATAAAAKLSKAGGDILTGVISTDAVTVGGLRAGDLVWDATGARTAGKGVALTQKGIVGHNGTNVTFSVNSTTGDATFAGTLSVASASTGARTEISNTVIKVFDGTRLRVQIGDLSA